MKHIDNAVHQRTATGNESISSIVTRAICYSTGALLFVGPLSSWVGIVSAMIAVILGNFAAVYLKLRDIRTTVVLVGCLAMIVCSQYVDRTVFRWMTELLGIEVVLHAIDGITFGLLALGITVLLRTLADESSILRMGELICLMLPVVQYFSGHRDMHLGRPRFFADWALMHGLDPHSLLLAVGTVTASVTILLRSRQRQGQSLGSIIIFVLFCLVGYQSLVIFVPQGHLMPSCDRRRVDDLGQASAESTQKTDASATNRSRDADSQNADRSWPSQSPIDEMPFAPNPNPRPPVPIGVVTLSDDYLPGDRVWHFRTAALSHFNGQRFVVASGAGLDEDIPRGFPVDKVELQACNLSESHTEVIRMTVGLLNTQSRPLCLISPQVIEPGRATHSDLFVTSYRVESRVPKASVHEGAYLIEMIKLSAGSPTWTEQTKQHYVVAPEDPRYSALAAQIMTESVDLESVKPQLRDSAYLKALCVRRWIEKNMTYSMKTGQRADANPVSKFLFDTRRGYCVHVAHAVACLLRTLGVPSRVATGFAVKAERVTTKTSVMIQSTDAHAWAEIYLDGIGWLPVDAALENVQPDTPSSQVVDATTARYLANKLRDSEFENQSETTSTVDVRTELARKVLMIAIGLIFVSPYVIKASRRFLPLAAPQRTRFRYCYRAVLDKLSEVGLYRVAGETREEFSDRVAYWVPQLVNLTTAHERCANRPESTMEYDWNSLQKATERQIALRFSLRQRLLGLLNPFSWVKVI